MSNDENTGSRFRGRVRTLRGPDSDGIDLGVTMRDEGVNQQNMDVDSHDQFFGNALDEEGKKQAQRDRHKLRFMGALADLLGRTSVPSLTGVETHTVSDDTWMQLMAHPEVWEDEGFQPLSQYQKKIIQERPDGTVKVLRALIPGEVGIIEKNGRVYYLVMETDDGKRQFAGGADFHSEVSYPSENPQEPDPNEREVRTKGAK